MNDIDLKALEVAVAQYGSVLLGGAPPTEIEIMLQGLGYTTKRAPEGMWVKHG